MSRRTLARQAAGEACYVGSSAVVLKLHPPKPHR
jgi:hypothetical protein